MLQSTTTSKGVGGVIVRDHVFSMPLDWTNAAETEHIRVFVRELRAADTTASPNVLEGESVAARGPAVMYLQGGPGFPSPRPSAPPGGWMKSALKKGMRVLLLDQRGTGASTAVTAQLLDALHARGGVDLQLNYLTNMRSDAIAADVEAIRVALCGPKGKITLLGQSFGGFCMLSYMSYYPTSLDRCLFTCGLAPITQSIREVYTATYRRMITRNKRFYTRYPADVKKVKSIVEFLSSQPSPVVLPNGGHLTVRRFLQLGLLLGSGSGMESLHWALENPFFEEPTDGVPGSGALSEHFLFAVQENQSCFETNPIYWFLHESIYMNGNSTVSGWAAESVMNSSEFKVVFDPLNALQNEDAVVNFTGEMVFSWMAEDYARLRPYKNLAELVAKKSWDRPLYDLVALSNSADAIPCAALVSYDDVYVERTFSEATARLLGDEDACKLWVSNEFQHSGLRDYPGRVFDTLYSMTKGEISLPS